MLKHRIIPLVLLDGYSVVKTVGFSQERRNLGNPITIARIYEGRQVDELVLLDIDAAKEQRHIDFETIEDVASECFMPLTVGGGLQTIEDIGSVLARGADKVVINTAALRNQLFIQEAANVFGQQCIVVSVDILNENGRYRVYSHATGKTIEDEYLDYIRIAQDMGAGEIILNSVNSDGMMKGYDIPLVEKVASIMQVPLIAAGGAQTEDDAVKVIKAGADAAAIASIFHFTSITPLSVKMAMDREGLPVRLQ